MATWPDKPMQTAHARRHMQTQTHVKNAHADSCKRAPCENAHTDSCKRAPSVNAHLVKTRIARRHANPVCLMMTMMTSGHLRIPPYKYTEAKEGILIDIEIETLTDNLQPVDVARILPTKPTNFNIIWSICQYEFTTTRQKMSIM